MRRPFSIRPANCVVVAKASRIEPGAARAAAATPGGRLSQPGAEDFPGGDTIGRGIDRIQRGHALSRRRLHRHVGLLLIVGGVVGGVGQRLAGGNEQVAHCNRRRIAEDLGVDLGNGIGDLAVDGGRKGHGDSSLR
ncbi:hypothetical protein XAC2852_580170 [Xanthomonas citri pv. citri]|nr:hypothetical protein XAC2852_580170 [Xanthomonas citri pv. citri]